MSNPDELRAAAQQALVALVHHTDQTRPIQRTADAIAALRLALAQQPANIRPDSELLAETLADCRVMGALPAGSLEPGSVPPELDVRRIMIDIVPGEDGMGLEVYAKSVADVEKRMTELCDQIPEGRDTAAQPTQPEAVEALAHRIAWRYKKSSDPAHSDTYTFNRSTLLQFAQALQAAPARAPMTDGPWHKLYRRAINEANSLTNYVEDRPELRGAERRLTAIEAEARALVAAATPAQGGAS